MEWVPGVDPTVRVVLAAVLGLAIGFERERSGHAAGTRTFASVAVGAALLGLVSTMGFEAFVDSGGSNVRVDVTRVASQVVVGIGFLGAGLIFRRGDTVQNLTTAATLWVTAAVGLAAGLGMAGISIVVVALLLLLLAVVPAIQSRLLERHLGLVHHLRVTLVPDAVPAQVRPLFEGDGPRTTREVLAKSDGQVTIDIWVEVQAAGQLDDLIERLVLSPAVAGCRPID